jgi:DNA polymerase
MTTIIIDFETYSPVPISSGAMKYLSHPDAAIVCAAYKEYPDGQIGTWLPGDEVPAAIINAECIYAHNALFDYRVWNMLSPFPRRPLCHWIDSMALCGRYSLPQSLEKAGAALKLHQQKDSYGKTLLKKICCPTSSGQRPRQGYDFAYKDMVDLVTYCMQDVRSTCELLQALPSDKLSENEQALWILTQRMNNMGLPVDVESVKAIARYVQVYIEEQIVLLPELTNGQVTKPTQVARIKNFCADQGYPIESLAAEILSDLLDNDESMPANVRTILECRQELGKSSTAKYAKIMELAHEETVYDNLRYYGTGTGRWSGQGFQMHNLPRATIKDVPGTIKKFKRIEEIENPVHAAKALIRSMVRAPKGQKILVSDYSAIECVLLHWLAEDHETMQLIRNKGSQYIDMASYLFRVPYDEIAEGHAAKDSYYSGLRQVGKIIILGCGYGMGHTKFQAVAKQQGSILSKKEAQEAVLAYRMKYFKVKQMWNSYAVMLKQAVQYLNTPFMANGCMFKTTVVKGLRILMIKLPSGRSIFYLNPRITEGMYGDVVVHDGTDPVTKQWGPKELIPGRITENIVQGLARDVMALGLQNVDKYMPEVALIGTVHDEAIGRIDDEWIKDDTQERFNDLLCSKGMDNWTATIPLTAEGYIAERYKKG